MRFDLWFDLKLYISYYAHILMPGVDPFSCNFNRKKTTSPTYVYFNMDRETDRRCGRVSGQPPCTTHYSSLQHHSCQLLRLETRTCECATCIHISIYTQTTWRQRERGRENGRLYAAYMCAWWLASMCCRPLSPWCECLLPAQNDCSKTGMPDCRRDNSGRKVWQHIVEQHGSEAGTCRRSHWPHTRQLIGRRDVSGRPSRSLGLPVDAELRNALVLAAPDTAVKHRRCASVPRRSCRSTVMLGSSNDRQHSLHRRGTFWFEFKFSLVYVLHLTKCSGFVTHVPAVC